MMTLGRLHELNFCLTWVCKAKKETFLCDRNFRRRSYWCSNQQTCIK